MVDVAANMGVDGGQCLAELGRCRWLVGGQQWSQEPVVDLGVEDRDALASSRVPFPPDSDLLK